VISSNKEEHLLSPIKINIHTTIETSNYLLKKRMYYIFILDILARCVYVCGREEECGCIPLPVLKPKIDYLFVLPCFVIPFCFYSAVNT